MCRKKIEDEMSFNSYVSFPNSYILIARARIDYEMVHNVATMEVPIIFFSSMSVHAHQNKISY